MHAKLNNDEREREREASPLLGTCDPLFSLSWSKIDLLSHHDRLPMQRQPVSPATGTRDKTQKGGEEKLGQL